MQAPAHPDDETNALFAFFGHGMGLRSIDVQNNRGDGGQNEIGPELFRDMGVLRTSELLSAHRIDGAEQYFTRAIDYGYSFDPAGSHRQVGPRGDRRRFRAPDPHAPARRGPHDEHPGPRRRSRARSDHHPGARSLPRGRRSRRCTRSRSAKGCAPGSRRSCISPPASAARRRRPWRRGQAPPPQPPPPPAGEAHAGQHRDVRPAAGPHLRRDRRRRAQQSQVPGHGRTAAAARAVGGRPRRARRRRLPAGRHHHPRREGQGRDVAVRRHRYQPGGLAQYAGANPPRGSDRRRWRRSPTQARRAQSAFDAGNDAGTAAPVEAGLAAVRALRARLGSHGADRRGALRNRFPARARRSATTRTPCSPRTA